MVWVVWAAWAEWEVSKRISEVEKKSTLGLSLAFPVARITYLLIDISLVHAVLFYYMYDMLNPVVVEFSYSRRNDNPPLIT